MGINGWALVALEFGSPAMLFGLAAASIPIIIHLLHRRRYQETSWAAMRFLMEAARKQSRRLRWEQLLVLLVRCLAVGLLASAFSRPFFESAFSAVAGREPRHVIVAFDNSFSMAYKDGNSTRLERGKETVRQLISGSLAGDGYSLVCLAPGRQVELISPTYRKESFLSELELIEIAEQPIDLAGTLSTLETILRESPQPREKEILIVSDFQQRDWDLTANERSLIESRLAQVAGENVGFTLLDVGGGEIGNLALTGIDISPQPVLVGQESAIVVSLRSFGGLPIAGVTVELLVDDRTIASRALDGISGEEAEIPFAHTWSAAGEHRVTARLVTDQLETDNARYQVVTVRDSVRVLLVEGRPAGSRREQSSYYLKTALETVRHPVTGEPLFEVTVSDVLGMSDLPLARFDVLALCNLPGLGENQMLRIRRHLSAGGGLLLIHGDLTEPDLWNPQLNRLTEEGLWPTELKGIASENANEDVWGFLASDLTHPIVKPFAGNPGSGLESAVTWQRVGWTVREPAETRPVLLFDDGATAIEEILLPMGRCLQVAMACDASSGSWAPLSGSFPPLVIEMFRYLSLDGGAAETLRVGQTMSGVLPPDQFVPEIFITTPAEKQMRVEPAVSNDINSLRLWHFDETDRSGFYQVEFGLPGIPSALKAVNVNPLEGDLKQSSKQRIKKELFDDAGARLRASPAISNARGPVSTSQESPVSQWLLWIGLAFLAVEVVLAWRFPAGVAVLGTFVMVAGVIVLARWIGPAPSISGGILIGCMIVLLLVKRRFDAQRAARGFKRI